MERWGKEFVVLLVIAMPAALGFSLSVLAVKTTCGLLWHSSCQARMISVRHLDESVRVSQQHLTLKRSKVWPFATGN